MHGVPSGDKVFKPHAAIVFSYIAYRMVPNFHSVKFSKKSINSVKIKFCKNFFVIAYTVVFMKHEQTPTDGYCKAVNMQ